MRFRFAAFAAFAAIAVILAIAAPTAAQDNDISRGCRVAAKWTYVACGHGYVNSGGNKDETSAQYKFAQPMCAQAAGVAGEACLGGAFKDYLGKSGKGECTDIGNFISDAINLSCETSTKDGKQRAECATWAKSGTADFIAWCQSQGGDKTPTKSEKTAPSTSL